MTSDISEDDGGYPWLSWALTGILTLAGVIVVGLVISVRNPRSQTVAAQKGAGDVAKPEVRPPASTGAPRSLPETPPPAVETSPPDTGSSSPAAGDPAAVEETSPPVVAPVTPPPAKSSTVPRVSVPVSPPATPLTASPADGPALPPVVATVKPSPARQSAATEDRAKRDAFVRAVAAVRASMAQRNLTASKRNLETAAANAQSENDQAELERLQVLQDHLEQFWTGIRDAVAAMQPVDEIVLTESNRVAVIEASRKELAVQWEGRPRRYRIEAIPAGLLWAIARQSFKPTAGSKLIAGSFLAMDALGDRAAAGKLWQEAIRGGESQGKLLLPELDIPRAAGPRAARP